jgi:hypothetical protein
MICCAASPVMPLRAMPSRSWSSIFFIRCADRLKPIARRRSSAWPPVNRRHHRNSQQLFLEKGHAKRPREDRLERRMRHCTGSRPARRFKTDAPSARQWDPAG